MPPVENVPVPPARLKEFSETDPVTVAIRILSLRVVSAPETSTTLILVVFVTLPLTTKVSAEPVAKFTSILTIPPPIKLLPIVSVSPADSSDVERVPVTVRLFVRKVWVPYIDNVAPSPIVMLSQFCKLFAFTMKAPAAKFNMSSDVSVPASVPPSKTAAVRIFPPFKVSTSTPPLSEIEFRICAPALTIIVLCPSSFLIAWPLAASRIAPLFKVISTEPPRV